MTAAKYDIEIDQGSDFALALTIKENNVAKNLSAYSARGQLRPTVDSPDSKKTDFTFDLTNSANGVIIMQLPHGTSAAMEAGMYVYDLEIFIGTTTVTRIMQGRATVSPEVTR